MRHRPARSPLPRRVVGPALVITAVTALLLAVPVVSGRGNAAPPVGLDASSSATAERSDDGSPVVMGEDGGPQRAGGTAPRDTRRASTPAPSGARSSGTTAPGPSSPSTTSSGSSTAPGTPDPTPAGPSTTGSTTSDTSTAPSVAAGSSAPPTSPTSPTSSAEQSPPEQILPATPSAPSVVDQVLALVDQERVRVGCDALTADDALAAAAQAHSAAMRDGGSLGHDTDGSLSDLGGRAVAVARGTADPAAVVEGWLADPTERTALLECDLTTIGVGTVDGDGGPWWTAVLG
ncbi:MAG TPA: CAP domain-containing protein [Blastococcus sp.]|nr:CAP domain-containing protein [Blastococcus sp.]